LEFPGVGVFQGIGEVVPDDDAGGIVLGGGEGGAVELE
jgi:hypothetical protein